MWCNDNVGHDETMNFILFVDFFYELNMCTETTIYIIHFCVRKPACLQWNFCPLTPMTRLGPFGAKIAVFYKSSARLCKMGQRFQRRWTSINFSNTKMRIRCYASNQNKQANILAMFCLFGSKWKVFCVVFRTRWR